MGHHCWSGRSSVGVSQRGALSAGWDCAELWSGPGRGLRVVRPQCPVTTDHPAAGVPSTAGDDARQGNRAGCHIAEGLLTRSSVAAVSPDFHGRANPQPTE